MHKILDKTQSLYNNWKSIFEIEIDPIMNDRVVSISDPETITEGYYP